MILGQLLKSYREKQNLSVRVMARKIGVNHSSLHRFESGGEIESELLIKILRWMFSDA